jgi:hypothetical protein
MSPVRPAPVAIDLVSPRAAATSVAAFAAGSAAPINEKHRGLRSTCGAEKFALGPAGAPHRVPRRAAEARRVP